MLSRSRSRPVHDLTTSRLQIPTCRGMLTITMVWEDQTKVAGEDGG